MLGYNGGKSEAGRPGLCFCYLFNLLRETCPIFFADNPSRSASAGCFRFCCHARPQSCVGSGEAISGPVIRSGLLCVSGEVQSDANSSKSTNVFPVFLFTLTDDDVHFYPPPLLLKIENGMRMKVSRICMVRVSDEHSLSVDCRS